MNNTVNNIKVPMDVHLFIEYTSKSGKASGIDWFGKEVDVYADGIMLHVSRMEAVQSLINSLADACVDESTRMSVTIYNESNRYDNNSGYLIQPITNNLEKIHLCITDTTFYYKDNGGMIRVSSGDGLYEFAPYKAVEERVREAGGVFSGRRQVAIILSHSFIVGYDKEYNKEHLFEKYIKQYHKCVNDGIEIISLGLEALNFKYETPLDKKLLKELTTVPQWSRVCDYDKMLFYLNAIGRKLSEIKKIPKIPDNKTINQLINENITLDLYDEEQKYKQILKEQKAQEEQRRLKIEEEILERRKKKNIFAYGTVLCAILSVILFLKQWDAILYISVIGVVLHYCLGRHSQKESLSFFANIICIIMVILYIL